MARYQAPELTPAPAITPIASPVDTFARPVLDREAGNDLLRLADALKQVDAGLQGYFDREAKEDAKVDYAEGLRQFNENKKSWKEAVDSGAVPAGASPHFRRGWIEQELRLKGYEYDAQLRDAYAKAGLENEDDPSKLGSFVTDFTAKWMKENLAGYDTTLVAEQFIPVLHQSNDGLSKYHTAQRIAIVEQTVIDNTEQEINTLLGQAMQAGADPSTVGTQVSSLLTTQIANGLSGSKANKLAVDAIVNFALTTKDPEALNALDAIQAGSGPLGRTNYAQEQRLIAETKIQNQRESDIRWAWALQDRPYEVAARQWAVETRNRTRTDWAREDAKLAKQEVVNAANQDLTSQMILNPQQDYTDILAKLAQVDPEAARTLSSFREAVLDGREKVTDDRDVVTNLYDDMLSDPGSFDSTRIVREFTAKNLDLRTMQSLIDDAEKFRSTADHPFLRDFSYRDVVEGIERTVLGDPNQITGGKQYNAAEAKIAIREFAHVWIAEHPKGTRSDFLRALLDQRTKLIDLYSPEVTSEALSSRAQPAQGEQNPFDQFDQQQAQ